MRELIYPPISLLLGQRSKIASILNRCCSPQDEYVHFIPSNLINVVVQSGLSLKQSHTLVLPFKQVKEK